MNPNINVIKIALSKLGIKFKLVDINGDLVKLQTKKHTTAYFHANHTPFNDQTTTRICRDKQFQYLILKDYVQFPQTIGFLDPHISEHYDDYARPNSIPDIIEDIERQFSYPVIIKRNSGSFGSNIFKVANQKELRLAIMRIFDKNSNSYDYVLLAQEYINIEKEYRIVVYKKKILLLYEKNIDNANFTGNLSPLHWEGSRAIPCNDDSIIRKIGEFIEPMFEQLNLVYGGIDIAIDENGDFYLIELNSSPGLGIFIRDNGSKLVEEMYTTILKDYFEV